MQFQLELGQFMPKILRSGISIIVLDAYDSA